MNSNTPIAIIGCGAFGLSTALDLARKGFTNITCFDKYPVPSPIAAANDSNKMMDYTYVAPGETPSPGTRLMHEANQGWKSDPVFIPFYHQTGFIICASSEEPLKEMTARAKKLKEQGLRDYEFLDTPEKIRKHVPVYTGPLPDWRGYVLEEDMGWLHARDSLKSAFQECTRLGVKFVFGDDGEIVGLDSKNGVVTGVKGKSGKVTEAEQFVLTAGANAVNVIDSLGQLEAKCFTLAHFQVTPEEAEAFKGLPVIFNYEKGYHFEADEACTIKICNEYPGFTRNIDGESIPLHMMEIPLIAEQEVRQYLKETMPQFMDRPFTKTRICWCTDSPDRELIICRHPEYSNLTIGSGDSGKSFAIMPVVGKYIGKVVVNGEEGLDELDRKCWRWRPETSKDRDNKQERWGGKGIVTDLKEYKEWVSAENPEPHGVDLS